MPPTLLLETPSEDTRHDGNIGEEEQEVSSLRMEDFLCASRQSDTLAKQKENFL